MLRRFPPFGNISACLLLNACSLRAAEPLPLANVILQHYLEVTGGATAWARVHSEIDTGRIAWPEKGLAGSFTRYMTAPDHELESMDLQPAGRIDTGFENGVGWEQASGRKPRIKRGEELEAAAREARFHALTRWNEFYVHAETIGLESVDAEVCFKVSLIPRSGDPEIAYFSRASGLLIKRVIGSGDDSVTETYSDYKDFDGLKLPSLTTRHSGDDEDETIALASVSWNEPIPADFFHSAEGYSMKQTLILLIAAVLPAMAPQAQAQQAAAPRGPARQGTESGFATFQAKCLVCHGNPNVEGAPSPSTLRQFTPEKIYEALTTGQMKVQGQDLSDEQKKRVAESIAGRLLGTASQGDAAKMPNQCASNPAMTDPSAGPEWNGWGVDETNSRFQPASAAGLTPEQIPHLKLRWAFGFPGAISSYSEPAVASGRVFVSSDAGFVYSLSAQTGCVYWSYQTKAGVRNAITIGNVKSAAGTRPAVYSAT